MLENIQITKKDVKNITLKVKPSGEVILTAPKITSDEHIKFIIKKKNVIQQKGTVRLKDKKS